MFQQRNQQRTGMTLVELLVVVVILLVLAATVLPSVAGSVESRRSREAARIVSSFIAKAQSRSIGQSQWSGFTIIPIGTASAGSMTLYLADVPPPYRGDSARTAISGTLTSGTFLSGTWSGTTTLAGDLTTGTATTRPGDLIRLDGRGSFYEVAAISSGTLQFRLRGVGSTEDAGQSPHVAPWPTPSPATHTFEIFQQPVISGSPLQLPENRAIDVFWSGWGPPASYTLLGSGSTVSILFDGTGRLRQIVTTAPSGTLTRSRVTGPLFLLVGRADRVGQSFSSILSGTNDTLGANWQYPDSTWIAIDPMTGIVRSAACTVSQTSAINSQDWIRQALLSGGG
jgi:prepilin-type N-terminal cleavage/methylation domain-containing protein